MKVLYTNVWLLFAIDGRMEQLVILEGCEKMNPKFKNVQEDFST